MKPKYRFFADRLTKQVLAIALIIMLFTMMMTFIAAYRAIRGEIKGRYLNMMNVVSGKVHMEVKDIEIEAMNVLDEVERHLESPEAVMAALDKELRLNNSAEAYRPHCRSRSWLLSDQRAYLIRSHLSHLL